MLCPLHSNINKEQYTKSISAINPVAIENNPNSQHSHREATTCYHELTPCVVSKKNTKKDKDKSMMCVLYVYTVGKRANLKKKTSNSEEINYPLSSYTWLGVSVSQSTSQSGTTKILLLNRKFLKFHRNFLEGFGIGLKTFLD